jgi:uncharacterized protein
MERKIIAATSLRFAYNDADDSHDEGRFTGRASTYGGDPDSYGDIVAPGAFADTIRRKGKQRPLLWQHDPAQPIGIVELRDTPTALMVEGRINLDTQLGRDAYSNLKFGALDGLSIGFVTVKSIARKDDTRELIAVDLWETSLVTFPANTNARINDVKGLDPDDILALRACAANLRASAVPRQPAIKRLEALVCRFSRLASTLSTIR